MIINFVDTGIDFAANKFGYFMDSSALDGGGLFFSDTSLNADGYDHMFAYEGSGVDTIQIPPFAAGTFASNEYVLAWEDLAGGGDRDHDDMVLIVESVTNMSMLVPAPIFGAGGLAWMSLLSLVAWLRRQKL